MARHRHQPLEIKHWNLPDHSNAPKQDSKARTSWEELWPGAHRALSAGWGKEPVITFSAAAGI